MQKIDLYEAKGVQLNARLSWLKLGDRVFKEFFKRLRPSVHATRFQVGQVNGQRITELLDIIKEFINHYQAVFASQPLAPKRQLVIDQYCSVIP